MSPRFGLWVLAGALAALAVVGMASIGLFIAPFAAAAFFAASRWGRESAPLAGVVAGAGLVLLAIGLANLGSDPCPSSGSVVLGPGDGEASCGGISPWPWLALGGVLLVGAMARTRQAR